MNLNLDNNLLDIHLKPKHKHLKINEWKETKLKISAQRKEMIKVGEKSN